MKSRPIRYHQSNNNSRNKMNSTFNKAQRRHKQKQLAALSSPLKLSMSDIRKMSDQELYETLVANQNKIANDHDDRSSATNTSYNTRYNEADNRPLHINRANKANDPFRQAFDVNELYPLAASQQQRDKEREEMIHQQQIQQEQEASLLNHQESYQIAQQQQQQQQVANNEIMPIAKMQQVLSRPSTAAKHVIICGSCNELEAIIYIKDWDLNLCEACQELLQNKGMPEDNLIQLNQEQYDYAFDHKDPELKGDLNDESYEESQEFPVSYSISKDNKDYQEEQEEEEEDDDDDDEIHYQEEEEEDDENHYQDQQEEDNDEYSQDSYE